MLSPPKQPEDFAWEESDWREFEVGDEIKVVGLSKHFNMIGKVCEVAKVAWGRNHLEVSFPERGIRGWFGHYTNTFYKKENK